MNKYVIISLCICLHNMSFSQTNWRKGGNNATGIGGPVIGTNATWNAPLNFVTNGIQRMSIRSGFGPLSGYIGIGNNFSNPQSPLHVQGSGNFSNLGWTRGITLSNFGALTFSNTGIPGVNSSFFMGAPSNTPQGDFYFGTVPTIGGGPVKYAYKTFTPNPILVIRSTNNSFFL